MKIQQSLGPKTEASHGTWSLFSKKSQKNSFLYLFIFGCAGSLLLQGLFSSCIKQELLSICGVQASHHCGFGFSCCGARALGTWVLVFWLIVSRAQTQQSWRVGLVALRHVYYLPRPWMKPGSPALAGRFFTTEPPEKPCESENVSHSVVSYSATPWTCSPPGSSVHGILQGRTLEWIALPFSRGSSQHRDRTPVS